MDQATEPVILHLTRPVRDAVSRAAASRGISDAEIMRDWIEAGVATERPRPRGGLFVGDDPIAHRVDECLRDGFGEG